MDSFARYKIIRRLAGGSFIQCLLAEHPDFGRCALLVSQSELEMRHRKRCQELLEGVDYICATYETFSMDLSEKTVVRLNDAVAGIFKTGLNYFLSMEFIDMSMDEYLAGKPTQEKTRFFCKILKAVADMHKHGLYHLDLKPANIMVRNGNPVLIDFGLSLHPNCEHYAGRLVSDPAGVCVDRLENTGAYAAAADVYSGHVLAEKFDVYSLGCIYVELLSGSLPRPGHLLPHLPPETYALLRGMLNPNQKARWTVDHCLAAEDVVCEHEMRCFGSSDASDTDNSSTLHLRMHRNASESVDVPELSVATIGRQNSVPALSFQNPSCFNLSSSDVSIDFDSLHFEPNLLFVEEEE